jgi:hypothetical protein
MRAASTALSLNVWGGRIGAIFSVRMNMRPRFQCRGRYGPPEWFQLTASLRRLQARRGCPLSNTSGRFGLACFLQKFVATNARWHALSLLAQVARLCFESSYEVRWLLETAAPHDTIAQPIGFGFRSYAGVGGL